MADRDSASESDSSSIDGGPIMMPPSPVTREQLQKRIESLQQHNRVLKVELETYKLRVKALQEENRSLRQASVNIVSPLSLSFSATLLSFFFFFRPRERALAGFSGFHLAPAFGQACRGMVQIARWDGLGLRVWMPVVSRFRNDGWSVEWAESEIFMVGRLF